MCAHAGRTSARTEEKRESKKCSLPDTQEQPRAIALQLIAPSLFYLPDNVFRYASQAVRARAHAHARIRSLVGRVLVRVIFFAHASNL